ncbi:MAG: hypothetical protein U0795_15300 [Pirellulales bacterium]
MIQSRSCRRSWNLKLGSILLALTVAGPLTSPATFACGQQTPAELLEQLISDDEAVRDATITRLRDEGPAGLEQALQAAKIAIDASRRYLSAEEHQVAYPRAARAATAVDRVAGQYLAVRTGLYWYTDQAAAEKAARESGRPLLSLRLLGQLTDQESCANSRFFRTLLYVDPDIAKIMRDKFVLHWQSVRPVPIMTVDFGNGRTVRRPITGNSAHYVLTADGEVIDCLPGLYTPLAFREWLEKTHALATEISSLDPPARATRIREYHMQEAERVRQASAALLSPQNVDIAAVVVPAHINTGAVEANRRTFSKGRAEGPALQAFTGAVNAAAVENVDWAAVAEATADAVVFSPNAYSAMTHETGQDCQRQNSPMVVKLRRTVLADQLRNEHVLHQQLHSWFAVATELPGIDSLNRRVYDELFHMPAEDPWAGLIPSETYSALPAPREQAP